MNTISGWAAQKRSLLILNGFVCLLCLVSASLGAGDSLRDSLLEQDRVDVTFEVAVDSTQPGQSVFVLGDLPDLGGNDLARAVKLEPSNFPVWRVAMRLPAGVSYRYQFVIRRDAAEAWSDPNNGWSQGEPVEARTPPSPGPPLLRRVSVSDDSPYRTVTVLDSRGDSRVTQNLEGSGNRRVALDLPFHPGDSLRFSGPGASGLTRRTDAQQFYLDGAESKGRWWISGGTNSQPEASRVVVHEAFSSAILDQSRNLRVYIPRGYEQQSERRYPVLYLHDGQNVFSPGGAFGSWDVDAAADRMIDQGLVPELIIVGIDNSSDRMKEYLPPYSAIEGQAGIGDQYARSMIEEVAPFIESRYRTIADRDHRLVGGSSLGGLISAYMAWEEPEFASRAIIMSPSFWLNEIVDRFFDDDTRDVMLYLDSGDSGNANDGLLTTTGARDALLRASKFRLGLDLHHHIGFGDRHNEASWAKRFPLALQTVFDGRNQVSIDRDFDGDRDSDQKDRLILEKVIAGSRTIDALALARLDLDGSDVIDADDLVRFDSH